MARKKKDNDELIKKGKKAYKKAVKKHGKEKVLTVLLLLILIGGGIFFFLVYKGYISLEKPSHKPADAVTGVTYDDFQIHFMELGNKYNGDSTYIKAGDTDILIDAGSRKDSAEHHKAYLDQYVTDGKFEYVIATHADQDHISGFVGNKDGDTRTGLLYQYEVDTLIDFALSNKTSKTYMEYLDAVDYLVSKGTKHYTAAECFDEKNGAKKSYKLSDNASMDILYNKYYFEKDNDENNYSVVTLFNYMDKKFLLTGDLEKEGEEAMAEYYKSHEGLGHVDLFKAGHHGSKTSSNDVLLELITPDISTVCCCAGAAEYTNYNNNTFPTQDYINRISKYTDQVYAITYWDEAAKEYKSLNGTIIVSTNGSDVAVAATNNTTKLKDSAWFNEEIYIDSKGRFKSDNDITLDPFNAKTPGVTKVPRRVWPGANA